MGHGDLAQHVVAGHGQEALTLLFTGRAPVKIADRIEREALVAQQRFRRLLPNDELRIPQPRQKH